MTSVYKNFAILLCLCGAALNCRPKLMNTSELESKSSLLFDQSSIATVSFSMQGEEFDKMRIEGRDISDKINECRADVEEDPYQKYKVSGISLNGSGLGSATLTKKGYMGSLSAARPSFKLKDLSNDKDDIILNSDRQDPSHIKQCLAYFFVEKAGINTPKCQLAEVHIRAGGSSKHLGLYTMVENPKTAYDKINGQSGILVEGTHADFSDTGRGRFEIKSKNAAKYKSKIDGLVNSVTQILNSSPSSSAYEKLSELIDLDSFYKYWATEAMIGHWDGYANNMNNFLFFVPDEGNSLGKIHFLPWGTDGTFVKTDIINRNVKNRLYHVSAAASLPNWLIKYEPSRKQYLATLKQLLGSVWGPEVMSKFQKLKNLSKKSSESRDSEYDAVMTKIEDYLEKQKRVIESELNSTSAQAYSSIEKGTIGCWFPIAQISGTIDAPKTTSPFTFDTAAAANSTLQLALVLGAEPKEAPVNISGASFSMRQVLENKDVSLTVAFTTPAIPNAKFAFSTITEQGSFNMTNQAFKHIGYANTGALQIQANPNAGDAGWMELGLIGGGSLTILEGGAEVKRGQVTLTDRAKISFSGTIYSKYPLSVLMKNFK